MKENLVFLIPQTPALTLYHSEIGNKDNYNLQKKNHSQNSHGKPPKYYKAESKNKKKTLIHLKKHYLLQNLYIINIAILVRVCGSYCSRPRLSASPGQGRRAMPWLWRLFFFLIYIFLNFSVLFCL